MRQTVRVGGDDAFAIGMGTLLQRKGAVLLQLDSVAGNQGLELGGVQGHARAGSGEGAGSHHGYTPLTLTGLGTQNNRDITNENIFMTAALKAGASGNGDLCSEAAMECNTQVVLVGIATDNGGITGNGEFAVIGSDNTGHAFQSTAGNICTGIIVNKKSCVPFATLNRAACHGEAGYACVIIFPITTKYADVSLHSTAGQGQGIIDRDRIRSAHNGTGSGCILDGKGRRTNVGCVVGYTYTEAVFGRGQIQFMAVQIQGDGLSVHGNIYVTGHVSQKGQCGAVCPVIQGIGKRRIGGVPYFCHIVSIAADLCRLQRLGLAFAMVVVMLLHSQSRGGNILQHHAQCQQQGEELLQSFGCFHNLFLLNN